MVKRLALDPGHGNKNLGMGAGYDPGASSGGIHEADLNLAWALTLNWVLTQGGIDVWLTRDDDADPDPVATRDDRAEAAGCTHFLSIHCNAGPPQATGIETFYRDARDREWAALVHSCALQGLGLKSRGLRGEGESQHKRLAVFDFDGPCALVELGYLTNAADRARLQSRDRRIAFAQALLRALKG
jgi:N-acetylmuramoyl-L-alanine amidase